MDFEKRYEKCSQLLHKYNQPHLLTFWDELNESGRDKLPQIKLGDTVYIS